MVMVDGDGGPGDIFLSKIAAVKVITSFLGRSPLLRTMKTNDHHAFWLEYKNMNAIVCLAAVSNISKHFKCVIFQLS